MSKISRLYAVGVLVTTAAIVVTQTSALSATAAAPKARDAAPGSAASVSVNNDRSQTPLQVRDHSAKLIGKLPTSQRLRVSIGLKSRDLAGQEAFINAVQDKHSPLFHKYLTAAQWNARFAPTAAAQAKVVKWAQDNGLKVTHTYPNHLLVDLDGSAAALESALHVSLNTYSLHGKAMFANANDPTLPSSINSVVSSVDGLNNIATLATSAPASMLAKTRTYSPGAVVQSGASAHASGSKTALQAALKAAKKQGATPSITGGSYDPTDIYSSQMYDEAALQRQSGCCNPTHNPGSSPPQTSIAIATVGNQAVSDMQGFQARYGYLAYNFNEINIDGTPTCCDGEGTMDLEWATALANSFGSFADTAHVWLYDGVNNLLTTFNDIYNQILTDGHAKIVSSSWGCAEDICYSTSTMDTNHNIFNAMIGQGYTLLNASDDQGAYASCTTTQRVQYPASDPDFLAISATNLELDSSGNYVSETAWPANSAGCTGNGGGGGGGCSDYFSAPSYQLSPANPNYFCGTANGKSKNFKSVPDVALNGDWFNSPQNLFFNGGFQGNGGTSIAAPEMAGFYAEQNSYGLELGNICGSGSSPCAPLGQGGVQMYLAALDHAAQGKNPFYDITSGCTTNNEGPGFCAITGYDRATGWGSINMLQFAWANNYWNMGEATPPTITLSGPTTGVYHNSGTLSWSVVDGGSPHPSGVAGYTAKWDSDPGDPASEPHPGAGNSFYTGPASAHGATSGSLALSSVPGQGCHTLFVRAWDNIGESAVNSYGPVCFDNTAPVATSPGVAFVKGSQLAKNGITPVQVSWTATDNLSGIASYQLKKSVDGGAYQVVTLPNPALNSIVLKLAPGHSYRFEVAPTDGAGNTGAFVAGSNHALSLIEQNAASISYSPGWSTQAVSSASGGSLAYTNTAARTATFTFTGRQIAWVSFQGPTRGSSKVKVDTAQSTVSNNLSTVFPRVIAYTRSAALGSHTLKITTNGTPGHPRVDLDAILTMT